MTDLDERILSLRERLEHSRMSKMRIEVERQQVQKNIDTLKERLSGLVDGNSLSAGELLEQLKSRLTDALDTAEKELSSM